MFSKRNLLARFRCSRSTVVLATPHIAGSTEEAQEIVGVRIAEQLVEYLSSGAAINAVNMPSHDGRAIPSSRALCGSGGPVWACS